MTGLLGMYRTCVKALEQALAEGWRAPWLTDERVRKYQDAYADTQMDLFE